MGVTRFDDLPENRVPVALRDARQTAAERKAGQFVGGSSIRYFRTDLPSALAFQLTATHPQFTSSGIAKLQITLTSDIAAAFLASLVVEVDTSTDGGSTWSPQVPLESTLGGSNYWELRAGDPVGAEPFKAKFTMNHLHTPVGSWRRVRVQALTTVPVTIVVEQLL